MKKRFLGLLFSAVIISMCVGCGAENATTGPTETVETTATAEESTTEPIVEPTETPADSTEQIIEETEEPSEAVETETETAEATPEPTVEPEPTEEPVPQYTYTDMSATMYAKQTVNVRDLPDTSGNKIGSLSTNDEITITGQCNENSWYRFEYNGSVAYVSNKYVGENQVEVQAPANNNSGSGSTTSTASHWYDGYECYTWYDMGEYYFYLTPTQAEANQTCGDCINGRFENEYLWKPELLSRYPDRKVSYFSNGADGFGIAVVCSNYEDATGFHRPKFIWE